MRVSFHVLQHILEPGVVNPMLGSGVSERKFLQVVSGDIFVEV
jgi:hypothetical protein